jgi:membrane protease YdiL (CAAX protease family)
MIGLLIVAFIFAKVTKGVRNKLAHQATQEAKEKMIEEAKQNPNQPLPPIPLRDKEPGPQNSEQKKPSRRDLLPLYSISPVICFVFVCIVAPLGEECVFRYLIFEIFSKNNPFAYAFSALGFIFLHWAGSAHMLFNLTTITLFLLTYLPITIILIYSYRKSKWNITYPIFLHFL